MNKNYFATGCVLCSLAVATGALGAHGLRNVLEPYSLEVYKTAVQYHFFHALGIIAISFMSANYSNQLSKFAFWFLVSGILLFSGSLYILSTKSIWSEMSFNWLGPITPLGGLFFIAGWISAALAVYQKK